MRGIAWLAENRLYSQEVLCSTEKECGEICRQFKKYIIFPTYKFYRIPAANVNSTYKGNNLESLVLVSKEKLWNLVVHIEEERRLNVFVSRWIRKIFRSKKNGVTGEWRKLHSEQHNDIYPSFIVRVIK